MALHLPTPRTSPMPGGLYAPLLPGEENLSFEDAAKAGWEEPYDLFVDTWTAYRWFLQCGYITTMGLRPAPRQDSEDGDARAGASTVQAASDRAALDILERVRIDRAATHYHMVRHAFRVALRDRARPDSDRACAVLSRLAAQDWMTRSGAKPCSD